MGVEGIYWEERIGWCCNLGGHFIHRDIGARKLYTELDPTFSLMVFGMENQLGPDCLIHTCNTKSKPISLDVKFIFCS